jgi:uncharacterized membrane protein
MTMSQVVSMPVMLDRRPIYPTLVPAVATLFAAALVTDLIYWRTALMTWETFSVWLARWRLWRALWTWRGGGGFMC